MYTGSYWFKVKQLVVLIYLNVSIVLSVLALEFFWMNMEFFELTGSGIKYSILKSSFLIITAIGIGKLLDIFGQKRLLFLRGYMYLRKTVYLIITAILIYSLTNLHYTILIVGSLSLFMLVNLFHLPVTMLFYKYWKTKSIPLILAFLVVTTYPFIVFSNRLTSYFVCFGEVYSFFILLFIVLHASWLTRKTFKKVPQYINYQFVEKVKTDWYRLIWSTIVVGVGNGALFSLYPKIFLMLNEPHGVVYEDAVLFREELFLVLFIVIVPLAWGMSYFAFEKLIKINNTILLLSVGCTIIFPVYFYLFAIVTVLSLGVSLTSCMLVIYNYTALKNRATGVGVLFGGIMSLTVLLGMIF